jgi:hypothetical protein
MNDDPDEVILPIMSTGGTTLCTLNSIKWDKWRERMDLNSYFSDTKSFYYQYSIFGGRTEKWDFKAFALQIDKLYKDAPGIPGKAGLYLDAQQNLLNLADERDYRIQTKLASRGAHGAIELMARLTGRGSRLDLRLVIDPAALDMGRAAYTGVYEVSAKGKDPRIETFRFGTMAAGFTSMLRRELDVITPADADVMNFCTIMDEL